MNDIHRTGALVDRALRFFDNDAKWSIVRIVQKGLQVNGQRDNFGFVVHAELS